MKTSLLLLTAVILSSTLQPATSKAADPKKLLVVTTTMGFRHSSIPTSEKVLADLAKRRGTFTVEFIQQPEGKPVSKPDANPETKAAEQKWEEQLKQLLSRLSPESLKNYDGVVFLNTTGNLPIPDREGFLQWIKSGKAFIGIHAASDTFHGWPEFIDMIGGEFKTHGAQVGVECLNMDPKHPANAGLDKTWTIPQEEIYQFKNYDPSKVHELLALDKHPNNKTPGNYPVSWCKDYGKGKVFYTSLGHREDIWDADPAIANRKNPVEVTKAFQSHVVAGIEWALGISKAEGK
jgi:uncharacterized protein